VCGLYSSGPGQSPVAGPCEYDDELSSFINGTKCLEELE
jgi:hypothetical protein